MTLSRRHYSPSMTDLTNGYCSLVQCKVNHQLNWTSYLSEENKWIEKHCLSSSAFKFEPWEKLKNLRWGWKSYWVLNLRQHNKLLAVMRLHHHPIATPFWSFLKKEVLGKWKFKKDRSLSRFISKLLIILRPALKTKLMRGGLMFNSHQFCLFTLWNLLIKSKGPVSLYPIALTSNFQN